jgi:hypothetical protein
MAAIFLGWAETFFDTDHFLQSMSKYSTDECPLLKNI